MEESFDPLDHHKKLFIHSINISEHLPCAKHCDDQINAFESINYVGETAVLIQRTHAAEKIRNGPVILRAEKPWKTINKSLGITGLPYEE